MNKLGNWLITKEQNQVKTIEKVYERVLQHDRHMTVKYINNLCV